MSDDNMNLSHEPCESIKLPAGWNENESITFQSAPPSATETWFRFSATANDELVVNGINLGPVADLAALVRDARRFRKLAAHYCGSGRPAHGAMQLERWDAEWMDWVPLSDKPLAEIADALPEVEKP